MKPWREVAVPHPDVLEGTFKQSEFAADLTAVRNGKAAREYQDAEAFFQRTFITEGMRLLLIQVAQRLNGKGGEPVVQLQTAFGGGKTHTMLAVYHLATRKCELGDLAGIPTLLDQEDLMEVPRARVAVLDGNDHGPNETRKHGKQTVHTLWGELAWQLGGNEAFALVKESDLSGTSPGKEVLRNLLDKHAPCLVLIDELVAYIRQFTKDKQLTGGSYNSNLSFLQALTEACKLVPSAMLLCSLPESEVEVGDQHGVAALRALEKTFGRIQALWKPVATEEAFEIVRRRLFQPVSDTKMKETVCRAFADAYVSEGIRLPSETQESRYHERLLQAYPIHPEVFDRLYEDWTTIDGFQRTRGVLKLMAKVIHRLWTDDNKDLMIMPGSLPLYDGGSHNELTYYLPVGWDAVVEKDIDGNRAETTELEAKEPRFGALNAARRVARTLFLGSAPSSVAMKAGIKGLDRARILLGCLQPGQPSSAYSDALNRLADRLHYLNSSGDRTVDTTRFWFDTRANLRREMEDRKKRFEDKNEVRGKLAEVLKKQTSGMNFFNGVHTFTPHSDIPDDTGLRLVILPPECHFSREDPHWAVDPVLDYIKSNGVKPRYRGNRLLFLAPDHGTLTRLRDCVRVALAWGSIVDDVKEGRLNIDQLQKKQAEREQASAEEVLPRVIRECYKWLLCPVQATPSETVPAVESFPLNTSAHSFGAEIERVCTENELVISAWSPIHLRARLKELYWKADKPAVGAMTFFEDTLRYLYLPRLKTRGVLEQAIVAGARGRDFFGTAYAQKEGKYEGFKLGDAHVQLDETLLLIEPEAAAKYEAAIVPPPKVTTDPDGTGTGGQTTTGTGGGTVVIPPPPPPPPVSKAVSFIGAVDVKPALARMKLTEIADEIIKLLVADSNAEVKVTLEIQADFPHGVSDQIRRAVSENANSLGFKNKSWE